jgi:GST-like protein
LQRSSNDGDCTITPSNDPAEDTLGATHRLLGCKGCGSAIVEAAFALAGVPLEYEEVDYSPGSPTRDRLLAVNPLGQVPALILPDARVLTESLAILHYLDDLEPGATLVPPPGDATRSAFYRWIVFIVAAIYPTYTYGDDPRKWVANEEGAKQLRESTDRHREALWLQVEAVAGAPWLLGERSSALDLYLAVMTRWRPGVLWFAKHTPKVATIAMRAAALDAVAPVMKRNFG